MKNHKVKKKTICQNLIYIILLLLMAVFFVSCGKKTERNDVFKEDAKYSLPDELKAAIGFDYVGDRLFFYSKEFKYTSKDGKNKLIWTVLDVNQPEVEGSPVYFYADENAEESEVYYGGGKSVEETTGMIQNRAEIYIKENQ